MEGLENLGLQKATYNAIRMIIVSNQPDGQVTGTAYTQLSMLERLLTGYDNTGYNNAVAA